MEGGKERRQEGRRRATIQRRFARRLSGAYFRVACQDSKSRLAGQSRENKKGEKEKKKIGSADLWGKFHFLAAAAGWGVSGGGGGGRGGTKRDAEWGRSGEIRGDAGD